MRNHILILHNIRSAQNVGAMFRTAEAAGIDEIILSGYSAAPKDRFGRDEKKVAKAALGAENMVPWRQTGDIISEIEALKKQRYHIGGVEQSKNSIDYKKHKISEREVIIMGNEVSGIEETVLQNVDTILEIPMSGSKESLNVSVACGIVLFRLFDR